MAEREIQSKLKICLNDFMKRYNWGKKTDTELDLLENDPEGILARIGIKIPDYSYKEIEDIIKDLHNEDWHIRCNTVDYLSLQRVESIADHFVKLIKDDPDIRVKIRAVNGLGRLRAISQIPLLATLLESPDTDEVLRLHSALAIMKMPREIFSISSNEYDTLNETEDSEFLIQYLKNWWSQKGKCLFEKSISELEKEEWDEIDLDKDVSLTWIPISYNNIIDIKLDGKGHLWAACLGGLVSLELENNKWTKISLCSVRTQERMETIKSAANRHVQSMHVMQDGEIWVKTYVGLVICKDHRVERRYYLDREGIEKEYNYLIKMAGKINIWPVDKSNRVWIYYRPRQRVRRYDGSKWETLRPGGDLIKDRDIDIHFIYQANDRAIWLSTTEGLFRYIDGNWEYFTNEASQCFAVKSGVILWEIRNGIIWVRNEKGLAEFDGKNWKTYTKEPSLICLPFIKDNKENIWAIGEKEIWEFNGKEEKQFSIKGLENIEQLSHSISNIFVDRNDNVWLMGDNLAKFDGSAWKIYENIGGTVNCAEQADGDKIWLGMDIGLGLFDSQSEQIKLFTFENSMSIP